MKGCINFRYRNFHQARATTVGGHWIHLYDLEKNLLSKYMVMLSVKRLWHFNVLKGSKKKKKSLFVKSLSNIAALGLAGWLGGCSIRQAIAQSEYLNLDKLPMSWITARVVMKHHVKWHHRRTGAGLRMPTKWASKLFSTDQPSFRNCRLCGEVRH